jgi:hypothetical protein
VSKLIFMSPEHVARMNEVLANDSASKAACAALGRRWDMAYELNHGAQKIWWTMTFDPARGVSFALQPPSRAADILYRGEYRAMLDWMRNHKAGRSQGPEPVIKSGDPEGTSIIDAAFQAAGRAATFDTEIPVV